MPVKKEVVKKLAVKPAPKAVKVSKPAAKSEKVAKAVTVERKVKTKTVNLSIPVYSLAGKESGQLSLPKEIFGGKINKLLLAQAIRVYTTNQKSFLGKTKTRGEIKASKAKIYRQKGTGRARHGAISAPIFVGGGIAFGPQVRKVRLSLPQKMKRAALVAALSSKALDRQIFGLSGVEKATGKTKEIVTLLKTVNPRQNALIVTASNMDNLVRGARNIEGVSIMNANLLNAYEVIKHEMLFLTKETVEKLANPASKSEKAPDSSSSKKMEGNKK